MWAEFRLKGRNYGAMDQHRAPYYKALREYGSGATLRFHLPGHSGGRWEASEWLKLLGEDALRCDTSQILGLDDIHRTFGPLQRAQSLASALYDVERTWFMVNGATGGVLAMMLAVLNPGDEVILPRRVHRSVNNGLLLSGAVPVYVPLPYDEVLGGCLGLEVSALERVLSQHPRAKAVLFETVNAYGTAVAARGLVETAHAHGALVLADEAWGAHLVAGGDLPGSACSAGADLVVQSPHKALSALSQAAWLHLQGQRVAADRVEQMLRRLQTTSPNSLLLASLDLARRELALRGREDWQRACELARAVRGQISNATPFACLEPRGEGGFDVTRLVISTRGLSLTGPQLERALRQRYDIQLDMSDISNGLAVISPAHSEDEGQRLVEALLDLGATVTRLAEESLHPSWPRWELVEMSPRQVFYAPQELVPFARLTGRISAQSATPYPLGAPIVCPGERITAEQAEFLQRAWREGWPFEDWAGGDELWCVR